MFCKVLIYVPHMCLKLNFIVISLLILYVTAVIEVWYLLNQFVICCYFCSDGELSSEHHNLRLVSRDIKIVIFSNLFKCIYCCLEIMFSFLKNVALQIWGCAGGLVTVPCKNRYLLIHFTIALSWIDFSPWNVGLHPPPPPQKYNLVSIVCHHTHQYGKLKVTMCVSCINFLYSQ